MWRPPGCKKDLSSCFQFAVGFSLRPPRLCVLTHFSRRSFDMVVACALYWCDALRLANFIAESVMRATAIVQIMDKCPAARVSRSALSRRMKTLMGDMPWGFCTYSSWTIENGDQETYA